MPLEWFKRSKEGITTSTEKKIEAPDGLWIKCPTCKKASHIRDLRENLHVCSSCEYHFQIGSAEYFAILFDNNQFKELFSNILPADPLSFEDTKQYAKRLEAAQKTTGLNDAARVATGNIDSSPVVIACMDFRFIGGSMGSVVGEKVSLAIQYARENRYPLIIVSKSGGARMMEGSLSLMQMAKTSAQLALLAQQKIPYISILTDPTTGGVTASFATLGDFNIAEPKALIGFAGPRVVKETIGKDLPKDFQTAEFLLEHGFVDFIVSRDKLKAKLASLLNMLKSNPMSHDVSG